MATLVKVLMLGPFMGRSADRRVRVLAVRLGVEHLGPLVELLQAGQITTVIDREFPLPDVPAALEYLGGGHAKGKVVVLVE